MGHDSTHRNVTNEIGAGVVNGDSAIAAASLSLGEANVDLGAAIRPNFKPNLPNGLLLAVQNNIHEAVWVAEFSPKPIHMLLPWNGFRFKRLRPDLRLVAPFPQKMTVFLCYAPQLQGWLLTKQCLQI